MKNIVFIITMIASLACSAAASRTVIPPITADLPPNPHPDIPSITNRIAVVVKETVGDPPTEPPEGASEAEWAKYREAYADWRFAAAEVRHGIVENLSEQELELYAWENETENLVETAAKKDAMWREMYMEPMTEKEKRERAKTARSMIDDLLHGGRSGPPWRRR